MCYSVVQNINEPTLHDLINDPVISQAPAFRDRMMQPPLAPQEEPAVLYNENLLDYFSAEWSVVDPYDNNSYQNVAYSTDVFSSGYMYTDRFVVDMYRSISNRARANTVASRM